MMTTSIFSNTRSFKFFAQAVREKQSMHASFASYNAVGTPRDHFKNGTTTENGLTITIASGSTDMMATARLSIEMVQQNLKAWAAGDMKGLKRSSAHIDAVAIRNQKKTAAQLHRTMTENHLLIVYAGLRAFDETLSSIQGIKREWPDVMIAVVTCDCDSKKKHISLDPLLNNGVIIHLVETPNCGGYTDMARLVRELQSAWAAR